MVKKIKIVADKPRNTNDTNKIDLEIESDKQDHLNKQIIHKSETYCKKWNAFHQPKALLI